MNLTWIEYEPEGETDDVMEEITRPVYESRVNIAHSPFEVPISENTVMRAGKNAAATRPLASNDPGAATTEINKAVLVPYLSQERCSTDQMSGRTNATSAALVRKQWNSTAVKLN